MILASQVFNYNIYLYFSFVLNTSVETPHDGSVNALKFRPFHEQSSLGMQHLVVTSSNDEKFKIWNLVDDTDIYSMFDLSPNMN